MTALVFSLRRYCINACLADAKRTLADRDRVAKEHLRDLTREELGKRIQASKAKVDAYKAKRTSEIALPSTSGECKACLPSMVCSADFMPPAAAAPAHAACHAGGPCGGPSA